MCVQISFDAEENIAAITVTEDYEAPSLIKQMKAVASAPTFNSKTKILIDESVVKNPPTNEEARAVARFQGSIFKGHHIVTIAPDDLLYGINRMISTLSNMEGCRSTVFKTLQEGITWLSVECLGKEVGFENPESVAAGEIVTSAKGSNQYSS